MLETNIIGNIINADEVSSLYKEFPSYWFLLEVLEKDETGKAALMKVTNYDLNKERLRDYLLDQETEGGNRFIFVYADPSGRCEM